MLSAYIMAAMHRATYELLPDDEASLASSPAFRVSWGMPRRWRRAGTICKVRWRTGSG